MISRFVTSSFLVYILSAKSFVCLLVKHDKLSNTDCAILQPTYKHSLFSLVCCSGCVMSAFGLFRGNATRIRGPLFPAWRRKWYILSRACLFLSKEARVSGDKACKFLLSHHLSPRCFPWWMFFINLSLLRVSDFLSPIYIRNYLLTLSFSLPQMQWQLLDFLLSHDSCQAEVLTKNPSLSSHVAWDLVSLGIKSKGPK